MYWEIWLKLGKVSFILAGFFVFIGIILGLLKSNLSYAGGLGFVVFFGIAGYFVIFGTNCYMYGLYKVSFDYMWKRWNVLTKP